MNKKKVKRKKPVYLSLSILDISKTVMYEFWYNYIKPKHKEKAQLCYMDKDRFIVHVKTKDFYEDLSEDVEKRFDTSNYEAEKPLAVSINKKVVLLIKHKLGRKITITFVALTTKAYSSSIVIGGARTLFLVLSAY